MSLNAPIPKPHTKICKNKNCKKRFEVSEYMPLAVVCSPLCAIEYAKQQTAKKADKKRKETAKAKREFKAKDKKFLLNKAQAMFNAWIRQRDAKEPCISCGYISDGKNSRQWHAGHYRPAGQNSALRFNELNTHKQCSICNNYKSGNLVAYRENLIRKIGLEEVERLETEKPVKKWTTEELQDIINTYKAKLCK